MVCQQCMKIAASVHLTQIINNEKREIHLCEQCAAGHEQLAGDNAFYFTSPFSMHNLLASLLGKGQGYTIQPQEKTSAPTCDVCNMTYEQFTRSGRFGCAHCYEVFGSMLEPIFKKIHGNIRHQGKLPQRAGGKIKIKREIEALRIALNKEVQNEEYEKAATLRDRIRELETELNREEEEE